MTTTEANAYVNDHCRAVKLPRAGWVVIAHEHDRPIAYAATEQEAKSRAVDQLISESSES